MLSIVYVSASTGEAFPLDGGDAWIGTGASLRSRRLSYDLGWRGISAVSRDAREVSVELKWTSASAIDRFRRACDADAEANTPGTLVYAGVWETRAFFTASETTLVSQCLIVQSLTAVLVDGVWRKEMSMEFLPASSSGDLGLDYPHDYPHDYASSGRRTQVDTSSESSSPMKLVVYGPATNPYIQIGGNRYQVDVTVPAGSYLVVDGLFPSITLTSSDGAVEDCFSKGVRGDGSGSGEYVFERLEPGVSIVSWSGTFGFTLYWYIEESEPPCNP